MLLLLKKVDHVFRATSLKTTLEQLHAAEPTASMVAPTATRVTTVKWYNAHQQNEPDALIEVHHNQPSPLQNRYSGNSTVYGCPRPLLTDVVVESSPDVNRRKYRDAPLKDVPLGLLPLGHCANKPEVNGFKNHSHQQRHEQGKVHHAAL